MFHKKKVHQNKPLEGVSRSHSLSVWYYTDLSFNYRCTTPEWRSWYSLHIWSISFATVYIVYTEVLEAPNYFIFKYNDCISDLLRKD